MATAKKIPAQKTAPAKKAPVAKKAAAPAAAKKAPAAKKAAPAGGAMKPIKAAFNKTSLLAHLAETSSVDPKAVKAVLAALEATMLASLNKKAVGEFTLPGLLKISAVAVPAKKKRTGIDPFTKQERVFAAKPASVKLKVRSLKKLKDAAL
ncbi:MAG: HU family DNA-binding protein [Aquincola tertiaricarbonis]|uniref:HU family DNA-binding protein n=1 Tax=Aquincola TaxID=391952 RepID=UPI000614F276|nr:MULTISPECIES: HU family DNA-binding protein [Aquincola]MCR5867881.1 HU family DNA-binding protein [Aquincola sp. J276]